MADANSTVIDGQQALHPIALEATYQIENLALIASKVLDESAEPEIQAVKTLVDRIHSLNRVLMTTLDEPDTDPESLAIRVGMSRAAYGTSMNNCGRKG